VATEGHRVGVPLRRSPVGHLQAEGAPVPGEEDLRLDARPGVLDDVRERLLHEPVGGEVRRAVHRPGFPVDPEADLLT
jgi:hypothetical protein